MDANSSRESKRTRRSPSSTSPSLLSRGWCVLDLDDHTTTLVSIYAEEANMFFSETDPTTKAGIGMADDHGYVALHNHHNKELLGVFESMGHDLLSSISRGRFPDAVGSNLYI